MVTVIFANGDFNTMDKNGRKVEAIATFGGKIIDMGDSWRLRKTYTAHDIIDLKGAVVIPGLIDTHAHIGMAADSEGDGEMLIPTSVEELLADVRRRAASQPEGTWIAYPNTYPLRLDELRFPTLEELDEAAPNHPVSVDGFYATQINSAAFAALDLTTLPPGGKIIIGNDGKPTGTLLNCNALLAPYYPKREKTPQAEAIKRVMDEYLKNGITTTVEAISSPASIQAIAELAQQGRQTVRTRYTRMLPSGMDYDAIIESTKAMDMGNGEFARFIMCKKTVDGGILTGTSYMESGYNEIEEIFGLVNIGDDWRGNLVTDIDELVEAIIKTQEAGLQFAAHCVGSGASEKLLQAYERVNELAPIAEYRHVLMHADFMSASQLKRAADIGICLHFQPAWHYMDAPFIERIAGKAEMDKFMLYRTIEESGIRAGAGSDHMAKVDSVKSCNPYNPFLALYNMVTCKARDGKAYNEKQKISREKALRFYTCDAAETIFDEDLIGSLEVGKRADFVVLDRDYFTCPEEEIKSITPLCTVVDGKIVYKKKTVQ